MNAVTFHGAMRPDRDQIRNTGLSLMDVRHLVEVRCASTAATGHWRDVWRVDGNPFRSAELANQSAEALRGKGFVCRVRPVVY